MAAPALGRQSFSELVNAGPAPTQPLTQRLPWRSWKLVFTLAMIRGCILYSTPRNRLRMFTTRVMKAAARLDASAPCTPVAAPAAAVEAPAELELAEVRDRAGDAPSR